MLYDPMKDYDEVGQTFAKAADYIEEYGHTKGSYRDSTGAVCAVGSLHMVLFGGIFQENLDGTDTMKSTYYQCKLALYQKVGPHGITSWNDSREQTKDEVVRAFRSLAEEHKLIKV